jgi:hypothetical protein
MPDHATPTELPSPDDDPFFATFGESVAHTIDLTTWRQATRLGDMYGQLQSEISSAHEFETVAREAIRAKAFPMISRQHSAPKCAGVYRVKRNEIEAAQRGLLFTGAVEACQGLSTSHESLSLSITQIGICVVSYHADKGSWVHRLYQRDLRESVDDPVKLAEDLINRRHRHGYDELTGNVASRLSRRSVLAYAERATLLERSSARWRMGNGQPVPYQLITVSGQHDLILASMEMLRKLILDHQTFLFVSPALEKRGEMTIGDALKPLEYAVIGTVTDALNSVVDAGHYARDVARKLRAFVNEVGPKVVIGCYRASDIGPARVFYAHLDHAHEAAQVAMADSTLQAHRGYPVLLDLAREICQTSFGNSDFVATLKDAYTSAGQPYAFHQEFATS